MTGAQTMFYHRSHQRICDARASLARVDPHRNQFVPAICGYASSQSDDSRVTISHEVCERRVSGGPLPPLDFAERECSCIRGSECLRGIRKRLESYSP